MHAVSDRRRDLLTVAQATVQRTRKPGCCLASQRLKLLPLIRLGQCSVLEATLQPACIPITTPAGHTVRSYLMYTRTSTISSAPPAAASAVHLGSWQSGVLGTNFTRGQGLQGVGTRTLGLKHMTVTVTEPVFQGQLYPLIAPLQALLATRYHSRLGVDPT